MLRLLRSIATAVVFAGMVIFIGLPVLLIGLVYPFRSVIGVTSTFWAWVMLRMCGVELTSEGTEQVRDRRPRFFVGNHQSALDIPLLIYLLRGDVRFIAKRSLFRIPVFGWVMYRYGFVPMDRTQIRRSHRIITRMIHRLRRVPISFVVFPEGMRSSTDEVLPFRKGSLKICQRTGLPVVPFSIEGAGRVLPRGSLVVRPGPIRLVFGEPISAEDVSRLSGLELHDRVRAVILRQLGQQDHPKQPVLGMTG